jgi:ribonuclease HII
VRLCSLRPAQLLEFVFTRVNFVIVMPRPVPDFQIERALVDSGATFVAGMDEVGRGAIAGPVMVGVVVVHRDIVLRAEIPKGLADSKLLSEKRRETLVEPVREWCVSSAVGIAHASEIDTHGIMAALQLAGHRALAELAIQPDMVILDGPFDWLSTTSSSSSSTSGTRLPARHDSDMSDANRVRVVTQVKADQVCASVAAASIVSKVQRDHLMVDLHEQFPAYGWASNKGYGSAQHREAIRSMGACEFHRHSWNLC